MNRLLLYVLVLWPSLISAAATRRNQPALFLTCIPKSGTHLLKKCLGLMGRFELSLPGSLIEPMLNSNRSQGMLTHAFYNPETFKVLINNHYKIISLIRDPRDQAVSFIYFTKKNPKAWPALSSLSFDDALTQWIQNTALLYSDSWGRFKGNSMLSLRGIDDFYHRYMQWGEHEEVLVTRFELLVGEQGGGSHEAQLEELTRIANYLNLNLSPENIEGIAQKLFGNSRTFRNGHIGSWKTHFTDDHKRLFKEVAGNLLIELGYEKDLEW